ncbi:MAG: hypothetical protein COW65_07405 [Cytophagales bacterium CG18_big_fil_WC_8_21_14_2_50_42_9]|nr:MAG: hypothetical protein COW65_07405 [Cytophagales bacterium CG18_big_fil_WC_8_21_14_2_50_42_9]
MLIQHLKELEADNLVLRKAMAVVPPHGEYSLNPACLAIGPVLIVTADWGLKNR